MPDAIKQLTFLASFVCFFYLIVSLVRGYDAIDALVRVLVIGGTIVAVSGVYELWTGYNVFDHVDRFVPILVQTAAPVEAVRSGQT